MHTRSGLALMYLALCGLLVANPETSRGQDEIHEPPPIRRTRGAPEWPRDFETGLRAARAFATHFGVVETDSLLRRVNDIGYQVASVTGRGDVLFTFHILDVPDPNAFALPGGFVFVTRGILELGLTDEDLAHLLGHECAHVTERHFARADRVGGVLSLLETAAMVAAVFVAPGSSGGGYDQDPETGRWRQSVTGSAAAAQATSIFGGLFRELLVRGYGRGLEMEADEVGRRSAIRAGYAASGGVGLMEKLHAQIYEDQEYGYWRTHPFFDDRVAKARAVRDSDRPTTNEAETAAYRDRTSARLSGLAASIDEAPELVPPGTKDPHGRQVQVHDLGLEEESTALFLHRAALAADPSGGSSLTVELRLLQKRAERLHRRPEVFRSYGPLIADYDSLLEKAALLGSEFAEVRRAEAERDDLDQERRSAHPNALALIDRSDTGVTFLELFLANYPTDSRAPSIRYRLAEQYCLLERTDDAALHLATLARERPTLGAETDLVPEHARASESPELDPDSLAFWRTRSREKLRVVLPEAKELTTLAVVLSRADSDSVRVWAERGLANRAAGLDSLEIGSRFLDRYPDSPYAGAVEIRVETLAEKRYYQARLYESLQRYQDALTIYNELLLLAPRSRAAALSREGITRVQATARG